MFQIVMCDYEKLDALFSDERTTIHRINIPEKPCTVCGCTWQYTKPSDNDKPQGCYWCRNYNKEVKEQVYKRSLLFRGEYDDYGNAVYRKENAKGKPSFCSSCKCGENRRYIEDNAIGNSGNCVTCAITKKTHEEQSKTFRVLRKETLKHVRVVMVNCVESGRSLLVLPRGRVERYKVESLFFRCRVMNLELERQGIEERLDVCHKYPKVLKDGFAGRLEVKNLFIGLASINRSEKDKLPEWFDDEMAVAINDGDLIAATKSLSKKIGEFYGDKGRDRKKEQERNKAALERVASIIKECAPLPPTGDKELSLKTVRVMVEQALDKAETKYSGALKALETCGLDDQSLISSRFEAVQRLEGIASTLRQYQRACAANSINNSVVDQEIANWAMIGMMYPQDTLLGFSSSMFDNEIMWGTHTGLDGKQYLCGWQAKDYEHATYLAEIRALEAEAGSLSPLDADAAERAIELDNRRSEIEARYAHRVYEPDGTVNELYTTLNDQQLKAWEKQERERAERLRRQEAIAKQQEAAKVEMIDQLGTLTSTESINNTRIAFAFRADRITEEANPFGWNFEDAINMGCEDTPSVMVWRSYEQEIEKLKEIRTELINGTGDMGSLLTRARASEAMNKDYLERMITRLKYRVS